MLSVTVDRASLGAAALVIPGVPTAGLWIPEDGLERPTRTWERKQSSSSFVHGSVTTSAKLVQSQINLTVYAQGASTAARDALMDAVEAAFGQFIYALTITEDGQSKTYTCDAADTSWGPVDSQMTRAHMARCVLTIPCHPIPGAGGQTAALYVVAPTVPLA